MPNVALSHPGCDSEAPERHFESLAPVLQDTDSSATFDHGSVPRAELRHNMFGFGRA